MSWHFDIHDYVKTDKITIKKIKLKSPFTKALDKKTIEKNMSLPFSKETKKTQHLVVFPWFLHLFSIPCHYKTVTENLIM